jgi:hypothetical protein
MRITPVIALVLSGCAAVTCQPATVVVADKEERARVETVDVGRYETTASGRLEPVVAPRIVREQWIRADTGQWHRIDPAAFAAANVGDVVTVCR